MNEQEVPAVVFATAGHYASTRAIYKDAEAESKRHAKVVLEWFLNNPDKITSIRVNPNPSVTAVVSLRKRTDVVISPAKLKRSIGATAFNKLTTPVLDDSKIEDAIAKGLLDPQVVANCTTKTETEYVEARTVNSKEIEQ